MVVKYIVVICVVVETLSFIRVGTNGQKPAPKIHKLMIICIVVQTLSFIGSFTLFLFVVVKYIMPMRYCMHSFF